MRRKPKITLQESFTGWDAMMTALMNVRTRLVAEDEITGSVGITGTVTLFQDHGNNYRLKIESK